MEMGRQHQAALEDLLQWRRDVRHFRADPVSPETLSRLRAAMDCAPAVGNARPWRVLQVDDPAKRAAVIADFEAANEDAASGYDDDTAAQYRALKLAGLREAPVHLAVFTETDPTEGAGLGRQTMPEMLAYSTVTAIHTLWLAARAENIGVGWVSILHPDRIAAICDAPKSWVLTGYLCLGHPERYDDTPLLHRAGWQETKRTYWEVV